MTYQWNKWDLELEKKPTSDRLFDFVDTCPFGHCEASGVYAVCVSHERWVDVKGEKIVYIGASKNVRRRINSSRHPYIKLYRKLDNFLVYTRVIYCEDYMDLERRMIEIYKPRLNKYYKKP